MQDPFCWARCERVIAEVVTVRSAIRDRGHLARILARVVNSLLSTAAAHLGTLSDHSGQDVGILMHAVHRDPMFANARVRAHHAARKCRTPSAGPGVRGLLPK